MQVKIPSLFGGLAVGVTVTVFCLRKRKHVQECLTRAKKRAEWQWRLVSDAAVELNKLGLDVLAAEAEEEAVSVITRAMSASFPAYDWLYGPELRGKADHPLRVAAVRFSMLRTYRNTVLNGGLAIGLRFGGQLVGVCLACPFIAEDGSRGGLLDNPVCMPSSWPLLDESTYGKFPKLRALWLARGDGNLSHAGAPHAHWHVGILAVDPSAQAGGYGKRLLAAVHALADKARVPCYLDTCGEKLRSYYERQGYEVVDGRGYELSIPGDPYTIPDPLHNSGIVRHYGLLRPCRA